MNKTPTYFLRERNKKQTKPKFFCICKIEIKIKRQKKKRKKNIIMEFI